MARDDAAANGKTIAANMQKAVLSMIRFSSAFTLYGTDKLLTAISRQDGNNIPKTIRDLEATLDSMADTMAKQLSQNNREVVDSASAIADQFVHQSVQVLRLMDPRQVVRATSDLLQKSVDGTSNQLEDLNPAEEDMPLLAVEVLTSQVQ